MLIPKDKLCALAAAVHHKVKGACVCATGPRQGKVMPGRALICQSLFYMLNYWCLKGQNVQRRANLLGGHCLQCLAVAEKLVGGVLMTQRTDSFSGLQEQEELHLLACLGCLCQRDDHVLQQRSKGDVSQHLPPSSGP